MEFRFFPVLAVAIILAFAVSHAALPGEMYWRSVFPNTPMPKALRNLLIPTAGTKSMLVDMEKKATAAGNGNYGYGGSNPSEEFKGTKSMLVDMEKKKVTAVKNGNYGYGANPSEEFKGTKSMLADMEKKKVTADDNGNYGYGANPSEEFKGTKSMLVDMEKKKVTAASNGNYGYGANPNEEFKGNKNMLSDRVKSKDKENASPTNKDAYFFESDLHPGRKMNLKELSEKASKAAFLPRSVAESIPFSTQNFPQILKYFSLEAKSVEAGLLKETIENCERPAIEGEEKYCATSFESFVDLGVSKMGKNIKLLSNELEKETQNQEFTIGKGVKLMGETEVVCHKMNYAYAVFLCHSIDKTEVYTVPLVGEDGTRARGLAVCHKDTSAWNLNHLAFQILKVKPGTVPICHFLVRDTLAWVPN